jgi:hypothetical protein
LRARTETILVSLNLDFFMTQKYGFFPTFEWVLFREAYTTISLPPTNFPGLDPLLWALGLTH